MFLIVAMSISSGRSMLLLGELLGMKSNRGEERNSEVSSFYQCKYVNSNDKCGIGKARKLANHLRITVFV